MIKRLLIAVAMLCAVTEAQVPVTPIIQPRVTFVNASGGPCAGCKLSTFAAGTTTPLATYTDATGTSQNQNPIPLDAAGGANIWLGTNSYKLVLKDSLGATIWSVDRVNAGQLLPCSSANAIQSANSAVNALTCDPAITINTTNHTLNVGTLPANHVTIGALSTPTSWNLDTATPATALASLGVDPILYADQCTGTDIGMKINDCVTKLPLSGGYRVGTIILPNTASGNAAWATMVNLGPGVNLTGQGLLASKFSCTVAGDCLLYDASAAQTGGSSHAFTVGVASVLQGFTIVGNGTAAQNIFHFKDAVNLTVRDVAADGASGAGSTCFLLHDVNYWTERDTFDNVSSLFGCTVGWRFIADAGNPNQPHPSFGYNRFQNIKANPNNGQTAFSFEGNSFIFSGTYRITVNSDGPGNKIFHMQDGAEFFFNELHLNGETSNPTGLLFDLTSASNQFTWSGDFVFGGGLTSNFAAGSVVTHWLDSGGFSPQIINSTQYAVSSTQAQQIGTGINVNMVTQCGTYEGSASTNTPLAIGSQVYRLHVMCGGTIGQSIYLTQIIYAAQFTFGVNKVFYRVRDNGIWYPWKQEGFISDLPSSGTTGALPGAAISAGACANLTAVINNGTQLMSIAATPNSQTQLISGLHWDTAYISAINGPLVLTNDPSGTSVNHLVTQSPNGLVLTTLTSTLGGILGPCTAGCGTTGTATIATGGTASIVYDGATTSGDYIINSTTIPGAAHDFGPSPAGATSQILGQVLSTNASAGTYATAISTGSPAAVTVTVPVCNITSGSITPNITPTFNVRLIP